MADKPVLLCVEGAAEGLVVRVQEGGLNIGRADDNDLVLDDPDVSRFHAHLLFENGSLWLRDAGSRNGVYVGTHRLVDHKALKVGSMVTIGGHKFEVAWEDQIKDWRPAKKQASGAADAAATTAFRSQATVHNERPPAEVRRPEGANAAKTSRGWRFWPFSSNDRSE